MASTTTTYIPYFSEQKSNTIYAPVNKVTLKNDNKATSHSRYFNMGKNGNYLLSTNGIGNGVTPLSDNQISRLNTSKARLGDKFIESSMTLNTIVNKLNKSLNLPDDSLNTHAKILANDFNYYNRFKIANPNARLIKGYPHVFFVSPMCNILSDASGVLHSQFSGDDLFEYINKTSPYILQDLSRNNNKNTDFSMLLSNYAKSFSLSDEYINTDTYGKTFTGYKISFGKNNIDSKTAGSFDVTFNDTRNLDIYKLNKLWVEYISGSYRGMYSPRNEDIFYKVLDYTGACYYILTAEDGESIIFWSKYYGVYPSSIPSTQYSWGDGNAVNTPDLNITFQYSWKEDFNPQALVEFNYNARIAKMQYKTYDPIYDENLGTVGDTYAIRPYIELIVDNATGEYQYKLRFHNDK